MVLPQVTFLLPDGVEVPVGPGGILGRMSTATLSIDDPRVSEAHAMVSLRGGDLLLLALRGTLDVGRRKVVRVPLRLGMRIELVPGVTLTVVGLTLPATVLALAIDGAEPVPLVASAYMLDTDPVRLEPGYSPDAAAALWTTAAEGWRIRLRGEDARQLVAGQEWSLGGHQFRAVEVASSAAGVAPTVASPGEGAGPLTVVLRYDTVHVHRGGASAHIAGIPARILTELGRFAAPVPWEMVARTIWKGEPDRFVVRQNWDRHLKALRGRLREAGFREDLVRADGLGNVELFLQPGDRVVDES
jgi:hypothetical protein